MLLAHFGGSILWVFSTVLLQMEVPDAFRGRVFAAELALVTLTSSMSSYLTGHALDGGASPRSVSLWLGVAVLRARRAVAADPVAVEGVGRAAVAARSDGVGRRGTDRNAHGVK